MRSENKSRTPPYGDVRLFASAFLVIFFAFAKSDIIAVAIVILKPYGFSDILFAYNLRSKYHSAHAEYHCEAIELAAGE